MVLLISLLSLAFAEPTVEQLTHTLSARHLAVSCDELLALGDSEAVVHALIQTADTVQFPPWVAPRAARCVAGQAPYSTAALTASAAWVSDTQARGLGLVVVAQLDTLPSPVAVQLAQLAWQHSQSDTSFARYALPRMRRSAHPQIQALVR